MVSPSVEQVRRQADAGRVATSERQTTRESRNRRVQTRLMAISSAESPGRQRTGEGSMVVDLYCEINTFSDGVRTEVPRGLRQVAEHHGRRTTTKRGHFPLPARIGGCSAPTLVGAIAGIAYFKVAERFNIQGGVR